MYYITVIRNGIDVVVRKPYSDYADAVAAFNDYYKKRFGNATLTFQTEVLNGSFARSYAELNHIEDIKAEKDQITSQLYQMRYEEAAKTENSFDYDGRYFFLIESEVGIRDAEAWNSDDEDE